MSARKSQYCQAPDSNRDVKNASLWEEDRIRKLPMDHGFGQAIIAAGTSVARIAQPSILSGANWVGFDVRKGRWGLCLNTIHQKISRVGLRGGA
jgi:hypothetical protein